MTAALAHSFLSFTRVLKNRVGVIHHVCQRQVALSSKSVTPITIEQARTLLLDMVGTLYSTEEPTIVKRDDLLPLKERQEDCPVRSMQDSYQEVIIPLGQDPSFRQKYISFMKGLRFGRILEDLDTFAAHGMWLSKHLKLSWNIIKFVCCTKFHITAICDSKIVVCQTRLFSGNCVICYIHNQDPSKQQHMKSPLSTVTALVDRIDLHDVAISPVKDVKLCGHVTWVGRSSMEVTMVVEQEVDGRQKQMLTAQFVMVARNPETQKAAVVNGLQPANDQEWELFHTGELKKDKRQEEARKSLLKTAPNQGERNVVHDLFLQTVDQQSGSFNIRVKPENSVWMENTKLKTMLICHPEQKNLYNKIFGGFLMRQAFELAWANAALYCNKRPVIRVVDDIAFRRPVEIGSLLFLSSQIVYTEGPLMQIKVHAEVLDPLTGSRCTTNDFYFAFDSNKPDMPHVLPRTYSESMLFLDGMRHFKE